MQLKIFKRSTLILGCILLVTIAAVITLFVTADKWADNALLVYAIFIVVNFASAILYADYDLHYAQRQVKKMVSNGQIALARVNKGTIEKVIRDARMHKFVLWKLELQVVDQEMNKFTTTCIEKFSLEQAYMPSGHIYVTYNPEKPEEIYIIPNMVIQTITEFQPLIEAYEKSVNTTYLNVFYRNGLVLQTYKNTLKEANEVKGG